MKKISVLIADDHVLVRDAWSFAVKANPQFKVVAECGNGIETVEQAKSLRPDLVLMDISMPDMDGIEATKLIRKYAPETKILGVSSHVHPTYARRILQHGASGYVTKGSSSQELFHAISETINGKRYICKEIKNAITEQAFSEKDPNSAVNKLTQRELEIIELLKRGYSSKEIAEELFLSAKTVEVHRHNILKKLNLSNTAALINYIHQYLKN